MNTNPGDPGRRRVIRIGVAAGAAAALPLAPMTALSKPQDGDLFVLDDVEKDPVAVKASDVQVGKPLLVFPFDPASKEIRNDTKFNKVVLVRVADADLDAASKAQSAGGVLAYSAICTHQNCEAKTWVASDKSLVCFCHASKFLVLEQGRVAGGPAPRALPMLPLKLQGEQLAVGGPFSAPPGGATS